MYKQVIVVRKDLELSKGKMAAQVAHAAVECVLSSNARKKSAWLREGQKKVILYAKNEEELENIGKKCKKMNVNYSIIIDAGLTELEPGTMTCIGIGPDKEEIINKITGSLPLVK